MPDWTEANEFLSPEERIELASEMLQRWGSYLNQALQDQKTNDPKD